jgi:flavin reductase (DIM6/NTAB) family NADH-FMN oxidoreductase RutF
MTYGIYVLTTARGETVNGMIASWVSMVSFDPPLIMAAVHPNRYSHQLLEESSHFALNILAKTQKDYLARFKGDDPDRKFAGLQWEKGINGCPVLRDGIGCIACEVVARYKPGNHTLFIGRIVEAVCYRDEAPLSTLDYDGVYLGKK